MTRAEGRKVTVAELAVPRGELYEVQIRDPGVVRSVAFTLHERLVLTRGEPGFEERLSLFVEVSPDGPLRNRRFVVMAPGKVVTLEDGYQLAFCGTAVSPRSNAIVHVYEIRALS